MENESQKKSDLAGEALEKRYRKERVGKIVSNKMQKTVVVQVMRLAQHPRAKKVIKLFKKFKAHDEKQVAKPGDTVLIRETRPISKTKRWVLVKVLRS